MKFQLMSIAVGIAFALGAQAQTPSTQPRSTAGHTSDRQVKNADEDRIEAEYKAAREKCDPMQGNAKDVCQKEAKAKEKIAKADLEAQRKGTPHAQYEAAKTKAEQNYEVAKEKCEDQKGADKTACKKQAKADEDKALAEAKSARGSMASNAGAPKTSGK